MPRAIRHSLTDHLWHISHRCQKKQFLLKFMKERKKWLRRLYQARRRYRLCAQNCAATSNHGHLLVARQGDGETAQSMQLVADCTAQQLNRRKGAIGEDRYSVTAGQCDSHLTRCLGYIDLDMVPAGVLQHPEDCPHGGYRQFQTCPDATG